ncbi:MAG: hypothetical protein ACM3PY_01070 [Omnitrophica WOR_2 bacterium]
MGDIHINWESKPKTPAPGRERSVIAIGWVRFKLAGPGKAVHADSEMRVLGMMVVQDAAETGAANNILNSEESSYAGY